MPISAPPSVTGAAAGEFKETTAAYRKTGPVEKYPPVSNHIRGLILNGLGPVAPRVDELTRNGEVVTTTTIRAAEVAAKVQKGEVLTPSEIAQAHIAVREAFEVGLSDPKSPYYQENPALRAQRETELKALHNELMGYLTQETRRSEDTPVPVRRWQLPLRLAWPPIQWLRHDVIETRRITPPEDRALTSAEVTAARTQSRIVETYDQVRMRIINERFGGIRRTYASLSPEEKRLISYATSEELSMQFDDGRVRALLDEVTQHVSKRTIDDALEQGSPAEKALAKRAQKIEEERENILRRRNDLARVIRISEFQQFLGIDDATLSQTDIAEAIIRKLGIIDEREIARLKSDPDSAFNRFFQEAGPLGTITFVGEIFQYKLERFAQNRGVTPGRTERAAGEAPENLSRDALIGLSSEALALQLVYNKLTTDPVKYLTSQGISTTQAEAMVKEAVDTRQFAIKNPDGSFSLNHDKLGEWSDSDLAVLAVKKIVDLTNPTALAELIAKMDTALTTIIPDPAARGRKLDERIVNIKDLARIEDAAISDAEQQQIIKKFDKRSLALLVLLLGGLPLMSRVIKQMASNDQRAFQNMFA